MFLASLISAVLITSPQAAPQIELMLTGQGRFAQFAQPATIQTGEDGLTRMRALQVSDEPMQIGEHAYVGGWSWWAFDCSANTGRRTDFASVREDGHEGPSTPTREEMHLLYAGGDAAELGDVACGRTPVRIDARSLTEAVAMARQD